MVVLENTSILSQIGFPYKFRRKNRPARFRAPQHGLARSCAASCGRGAPPARHINAADFGANVNIE